MARAMKRNAFSWPLAIALALCWLIGLAVIVALR